MIEPMSEDAIHPTAIVSPGAKLGRDVIVGAYAIVHPGVTLGDRSVVGPHTILGEPASIRGEAEPEALVIGPGALIRSHSVVYAGSAIGEAHECGHHVLIRAGAVIGPGVRIGSFSGVEGDCRIGAHARLHSGVHVSQGTVIGRCAWLFPYVVTTHDPHPPSHDFRPVEIGDFAVIATRAVLLPGARIGPEAVVGAAAVVAGEVPAGALAVGNPARIVGSAALLCQEDGETPAYPWYRHFSRGMPWEGIGFDAWREAGSR